MIVMSLMFTSSYWSRERRYMLIQAKRLWDTTRLCLIRVKCCRQETRFSNNKYWCFCMNWTDAYAKSANIQLWRSCSVSTTVLHLRKKFCKFRSTLAFGKWYISWEVLEIFYFVSCNKCEDWVDKISSCNVIHVPVLRNPVERGSVFDDAQKPRKCSQYLKKSVTFIIYRSSEYSSVPQYN